jgi:hypothetical protein
LVYNNEIRDLFCEVYRKVGSVTKTAEKLKLCRQTIYAWLHKYEDFKTKFDEAKKIYRQVAVDEIAESLHSIATGEEVVEITEEYITDSDGKIQGEKKITKKIKKVRSVSAAIFLACNYDPENFKQRNTIENNVSGIIDINNIDIKLTDQEKIDYENRMSGYLGELVAEKGDIENG